MARTARMFLTTACAVLRDCIPSLFSIRPLLLFAFGMFSSMKCSLDVLGRLTCQLMACVYIFNHSTLKSCSNRGLQ